MLPPPIQPIPKLNFKNDQNSHRQSLFGAHKTWPEKLIDTIPSESNVQPSVVLPNTAHTMYHHKLNSNADDVNQLLGSSPMYSKSSQSKKSWIQDLLQKEVARPTMPPSYVQMETINLLKLNDMNHFNSKMPVAESQTEISPPYFVPTIHPSIAADNKLLFKDIPKPMTPMNLIIQGHSRVKSYGQGQEERDPKIIEVKSVENPVVNRVVSKDENGIQFDVKHLHGSSGNKTVSGSLNATAESENSLLSLLDLSFGEFLDSTPDVVNQTKVNENSIKVV